MPRLHSTSIQINPVEMAAILAGLRLLQNAGLENTLPPGIEEIATDCGEFHPLDEDEIDGLIQRITRPD